MSEKFLGSSSPPQINSHGSNNFLDKKVNQNASKMLFKMKADPLWALDKEFRAASWFKKAQ